MTSLGGRSVPASLDRPRAGPGDRPRTRRPGPARPASPRAARSPCTTRSSRSHTSPRRSTWPGLAGDGCSSASPAAIRLWQAAYSGRPERRACCRRRRPRARRGHRRPIRRRESAACGWESRWHMQGDLAEAADVLRALADEGAATTETTHDLLRDSALRACSYQGDAGAARAPRRSSAWRRRRRWAGFDGDAMHMRFRQRRPGRRRRLAARGGLRGEPGSTPCRSARSSSEASLSMPEAHWRAAIWPLPAGGPTTPSRWSPGCHLMVALTARARVALAQGEPDQAERDAHDALVIAAAHRWILVSRYLRVPGRLAAGREATTRTRRGFSAPRRRSGNAKASPASRSTKPTTTPLSRVRDALGTTSSTPHGQKVRPCPPRRRSPTRSAAAANANARPPDGNHSPPPNATSSGSSTKDWPTRTSPHGFSSHRAPCKPTSPTSTPNSASPPGCNSSKKPPAILKPQSPKGFPRGRTIGHQHQQVPWCIDFVYPDVAASDVTESQCAEVIGGRSWRRSGLAARS